MGLLIRKSIDELQHDATAEGHRSLERTVGQLNLVTLGVAIYFFDGRRNRVAGRRERAADARGAA